MTYKFEKDELLKLLIQAYNEGNSGFLDLAESTAETLINECKDEPVYNYNYNSDINLVVSSGHPSFLTSAAAPYVDTSLFRNSLDAVTPLLPEDTNNLVIINSNEQMGGTQWLPYPETDLLRKNNNGEEQSW